MTEKTCNVCGSAKPLDQYYKDSRRSDGRQSTCVPCEQVRRNAWRKGSPKARATAARQIRKPGQRFAVLRVSARQRGLELSLTREEYAAFIAKPCAYCGGSLPETGAGLDRVDTRLGYLPTNVVPCCAVCNGIKHKVFSYGEMLRIGATVAEIRREREMDGNPLGHPWDYSPSAQAAA